MESTVNFNTQLSKLEKDHMYHIGYSTHDDLSSFSDIKFCVFGGSYERMKSFAKKIYPFVEADLSALENKSSTDRYSMFKVGPVLCVNHGIGMPSINIVLHEITKLMHYAKAKNFCYIRLGTSGGIGIRPGSLVVSDQVFSGDFTNHFENIILGEKINRPALLCKTLSNDIIDSWKGDTPIVFGHTLSTNDFYEGQGRLDGAICSYTKEKKDAYLIKAHSLGIRNIEMESLAFASFCHHLNIPSAMVATTLLDRLEGDQISIDHNLLEEYADRLMELIISYIRSRISKMK